MTEFFKKIIRDLPVLAGVDMLLFLRDDEYVSLIHELVAVGNMPAFAGLSDDVKKRIVSDNILKDESVINPPFGCRPGLNKRLVAKWYFRHCEQHGEPRAEPEVKPDFLPATDEVADKYIKQLLTNFSGPTTVNHFDIEKEKRKIIAEDKERIAGRKGSGYISKESEIVKREAKRKAIERRGLHKVSLNELKYFKTPCGEILARTAAEAKSISDELREVNFKENIDASQEHTSAI